MGGHRRPYRAEGRLVLLLIVGLLKGRVEERRR
jgi:hypothetical protein